MLKSSSLRGGYDEAIQSKSILDSYVERLFSNCYHAYIFRLRQLCFAMTMILCKYVMLILYELSYSIIYAQK